MLSPNPPSEGFKSARNAMGGTFKISGRGTRNKVVFDSEKIQRFKFSEIAPDESRSDCGSDVTSPVAGKNLNREIEPIWFQNGIFFGLRPALGAEIGKDLSTYSVVT